MPWKVIKSNARNISPLNYLDHITNKCLTLIELNLLFSDHKQDLMYSE